MISYTLKSPQFYGSKSDATLYNTTSYYRPVLNHSLPVLNHSLPVQNQCKADGNDELDQRPGFLDAVFSPVVDLKLRC